MFRSKSSVFQSVVLVLMFFSYVPNAFADNDSSRTYSLEEITVTADKREENIQEVPSPITAFTETDLEDAGVTDIGDVIRLVPNMTFGHTFLGNEAIFRGIGYSQFTYKNPVTIYIDGIPYDHVYSFDADLLSIDRVEVLRGSQGALYGKNAIGGIINVISKKPGNTYEGRCGAEFAENETYGAKAYVNGPVVQDRLFFGISGSWRETGGFMKNDYPGEDYFDDNRSLRTKALLRWVPTDRLEMDFHAGFGHLRNDNGSVISDEDVRYRDIRDPDDKFETDIANMALNLAYALDRATFRSVSTYSDTEVDVRQNLNYYTSSPAWIGIHNTDRQSFSQEFRFQSNEDADGLKWTGGIYYSFEKEDINESGSIFTSTTGDYPGCTEDETVSVFGQITMPLTQKISFTAGSRYEYTHKELEQRYVKTRTDTGELLASSGYDIDEDWGAFLPKGILSWTLTEDAMIFASVSKGYLAGGLNAYELEKERAKFDEQVLIDYQFGAKTSWLGGKLFLNATLFYMDIKDMHVYTMPQPYVFVASNAAEAHSQGVEIEARVRPTKGLDLAAQLGWIDTEYDDYGNFSGNEIQRTPKYTLNLAAQYRHDSGIFERVEMKGDGKTYYNEANTVKQNGFEVFDARIGYEGYNWEAYLYVENLLDEEYFSYGRYTGIGPIMSVGTPRTFGVVAAVEF